MVTSVVAFGVRITGQVGHAQETPNGRVRTSEVRIDAEPTPPQEAAEISERSLWARGSTTSLDKL